MNHQSIKINRRDTAEKLLQTEIEKPPSHEWLRCKLR